jgi:vitamin D3 1,25-hydroxylase
LDPQVRTPGIESIRRQAELRFFVDATRNLGHQAATVELLERVIDETAFAGRVTVVHAEGDPAIVGSTVAKLALLLPGLDPRRIDDTVLTHGTCRDIRFVPYAARERLGPQIELGLTGGADDMSLNLARELRVRRFLRLQPYRWDDGFERRTDRWYQTSRIELPDGAHIDLAEHCPDLRHMPLRTSHGALTEVPDGVWDWYAGRQDFDPGLAFRTRGVRAILRARQAHPGLALWPVYGLQHFATQAAGMTANVLRCGLEVGAAIHAPIVALVLNAPASVVTLAALTASLPSGRLSVVRGRDDNGTDLDVSDGLRATLARAQPGDLIAVFLGPVPAVVYRHLLATSRLPPVVEGQGSVNLLLGLGRPFIHLRRPQGPDGSNYPALPTAAEVVAQAERAGLALRDAAGPQSALLEDAAAFLAAAYRGNAAVTDYFRAAAEEFARQPRDKFQVAMGLVMDSLAATGTRTRVDLPILDPRFKADPYPLYDEWRRAGHELVPVRLPSGMDAWLAIGYDTSRRLLEDPRLLKGPVRLPHRLFRHLLMLDPPEHTRLRSVLARELNARRVRQLRPRIAAVTDELLEDLVAHDRVDLIAAFARPLPLRVVCDLVGVPVAHQPRIASWARQLEVADLDAPEQVPAIATELHAYLLALAESKRASPDDSLVSAFVAARDRGELSADELVSMIFVLLLAGHETTTHLIANGLVALCTEPGAWQRFVADPERAPAIIEELLRYASPLEVATARIVAGGFSVDDVQLRAGERVFVGLGAANRDPARYPCPHQLDMQGRRATDHLAFGHGIHYCPGAALARLEADVAMRALARRCPAITLAGGGASLEWKPGLIMRGLERLIVHPGGSS